MARRQGKPTLRRGLGAGGVVCWGLWMTCVGCAPVWHLHYDQAEKAARGQNLPLLVFYKDSFDPSSSQIQDLLEEAEVKPLLSGKVRCMLTSEFPPYRRYVAQYGVMQPPALVLIHPDGTYHARQGPIGAEEVRDFFINAKPPGAEPNPNPQIPRTIDYQWQGIYEDAAALAVKQNRELFIVYKWWLSSESNELLATLLNRPEVARHFTETVNCLLDTAYLPNRTHVREYGVTGVPALILVHRDGTYHDHTGPMTAEQIVRWVSSAKAPGKRPAGTRIEPTESRAESRPEYRWYAEFSRAAAHARNRGVNLFVFFQSLYSEESSRMSQMLERGDVGALFADTINCRLDFSVPGNRALMRRYRIDRAPAFLIVRPDETYHARAGAIRAEDLAALVRAAKRPGLLPKPVGATP